MKRVLFVLETSGASGQDNNRALVYKPQFDQAGIHTDFIGWEPQHPAWLAHPKTRLAMRLRNSVEYNALAQVRFALARRANRARILSAARKADVVYLIKISSLELVQAIRQTTRGRLVYDLGDALWLPTFASSYKNLNDILKLADAVTSDNQFGVDYAKPYCRETHVWESYSQIETFDARRTSKPSTQGAPLTIGWLGSPGTLYNLYAAWEALEDVFKKFSHVHLRMVGAGTDASRWPPFEKVRYSTCPGYTNDEMFDHVLAMDIGLFPMFDVENSAVRGIMKALVYMSGEAAVIASPRGLCRELIRNGENGFLADSRREWAETLGRLIEDAALRKKISQQALTEVRQHFSMAKIFGDLRRILQV